MVSKSKSAKLRRGSFGSTNGEQNERRLKCDQDQAQTSYKEVQKDYCYESQEQVCSVLPYDVDREELDAYRQKTNCDIVASSIISLQSVQEALEREIQKFEVIGKASNSLSESSPTYAEEEFAFHGRQAQEIQLTKLDVEVHMLKSKLDEVSAMIRVKDHHISELESIESASASQSLREKCRALETELEGLFKQKIECEIEQLIVVNKTRSVTEEDQISFFEEQKSLAGKQIQVLHKLKDAEHKAGVLKNQAEEIEASCEQLLATAEVLKAQNRLYEYILYFAAQILLLFIVFVIFLLRPRAIEFVPT